MYNGHYRVECKECGGVEKTDLNGTGIEPVQCEDCGSWIFDDEPEPIEV